MNSIQSYHSLVWMPNAFKFFYIICNLSSTQVMSIPVQSHHLSYWRQSKKMPRFTEKVGANGKGLSHLWFATAFVNIWTTEMFLFHLSGVISYTGTLL